MGPSADLLALLAPQAIGMRLIGNFARCFFGAL